MERWQWVSVIVGAYLVGRLYIRSYADFAAMARASEVRRWGYSAGTRRGPAPLRAEPRCGTGLQGQRPGQR